MSNDPPPTAAAVPRFRVWVRRQPQSGGGFSIKFEVDDGKGILRVARPGVLIDPPARPTGSEERLTGPQLRASRFLHVWDGGKGRQGHSLTRLDESALDRLPGEVWIALVPSEDSALHYLFLPDVAPEEVEEEEGDQPTSPSKMLATLREDLSALGEGFEEAIEAGSATDEVPLAALAADDEEESATREIAPAIPVSRDAARAGSRTEPPTSTPRRASVDGPIIRLDPAPEDDGAAPATPLVRHLRRQLARQGSRILELEEEIRRLRAARA